MEEQDKKFSLPEIIIGTLVNGSLDFGEFIAGFFLAVPVIGQVIMAFMFFIKGFVWLIMQFWLIMKGVKGFWFLGGNLLELLPFVDMLPARTATWLTTCYFANNPKTAKLANKISKIPIK